MMHIHFLNSDCISFQDRNTASADAALRPIVAARVDDDISAIASLRIPHLEVPHHNVRAIGQGQQPFIRPAVQRWAATVRHGASVDDLSNPISSRSD
eukprot:CAMPEP_0179029122 /NCGR_PEP_ID=MMETSP0796-20121207/9894_1 /TAXON_ID=73915 /ORGANISM="Pyrodinium bahamense, Strain pbaha01" /LENGTH=96 /DNA_ID=CAMNT_0020725277 /DNA_START=131 /DNA_END=418 /DNA_ORIENTATION=-